MNEAYKDVRRLKMTLKTLEITWAEACCPPYTDAKVSNIKVSKIKFPNKSEHDCAYISKFITFSDI